MSGPKVCLVPHRQRLCLSLLPQVITTQTLFSTKISSFVSGCFYLHVHKELPRNVEPSQVLVITTIKLL